MEKRNEKQREFERELMGMVEKIKIHARQMYHNNQRGTGYSPMDNKLKHDFFRLIELCS